MAGDLGVGAGVLKQGGNDILAVLKPVKKVDLGDEAKQASEIGDDEAAAAMVAFCATWEGGAAFLADCAATLADGLNKANGDFHDTDQAIRDSVSSVKKVLV